MVGCKVCEREKADGIPFMSHYVDCNDRIKGTWTKGTRSVEL